MSTPTFSELHQEQRDMLALPCVQEWIAEHGDDAPLWPAGPTAQELNDFVIPFWMETVRRILQNARSPIYRRETPAKPRLTDSTKGTSCQQPT